MIIILEWCGDAYWQERGLDMWCTYGNVPYNRCWCCYCCCMLVAAIWCRGCFSHKYPPTASAICCFQQTMKPSKNYKQTRIKWKTTFIIKRLSCISVKHLCLARGCELWVRALWGNFVLNAFVCRQQQNHEQMQFVGMKLVAVAAAKANAKLFN